jgi:hypothetical protein
MNTCNISKEIGLYPVSCDEMQLGCFHCVKLREKYKRKETFLRYKGRPKKASRKH